MLLPLIMIKRSVYLYAIKFQDVSVKFNFLIIIFLRGENEDAYPVIVIAIRLRRSANPLMHGLNAMGLLRRPGSPPLPAPCNDTLL